MGTFDFFCSWKEGCFKPYPCHLDKNLLVDLPDIYSMCLALSDNAACLFNGGGNAKAMSQIIHRTHCDNTQHAFPSNQSSCDCVNGAITARGNDDIGMFVGCFFS